MNQHTNEHELYQDHGSGDKLASVEMMTARQVALDLLQAVLAQKQALDHVLERDQGFKALPSRDKAFCRMLVSTTLRRLGQIDDLIRRAEDKPGAKNITLENILRLGVTQIFFMQVPDHAAVDTAVRLADAAGMDKQKGFVNALLRTLTRTGQEWIKLQDQGRLNTPEWLLKIWIEDYGLREAAQIAAANLSEAPLDISIRDEGERNYLSANLKATELSAGTLRRSDGGAVHEMDGFEDGKWWIQDASAAIPASLFGGVKGKVVVDLCAAPGGKTMQLAARGAHVIALDRSAQRLGRLRENLKRLRLEENVEIVVADAAEWHPKEPPEMILLDAPCTATGTIRRHPDVPHLKTRKDFESLVEVQARILENAFNILAPGGVLVFCTCSLQKAEGELQVRFLLSNHDNATKIAIMPEELGDWDEAITEDGDLRILPYHRAALGGMDGFFISRIRKSN